MLTFGTNAPPHSLDEAADRRVLSLLDLSDLNSRLAVIVNAVRIHGIWGRVEGVSS